MSEGVPAGLVHGLELLEGLVNAYLRRATTLLEVARASSGKLNLQAAEVDFFGAGPAGHVKHAAVRRECLRKPFKLAAVTDIVKTCWPAR